MSRAGLKDCLVPLAVVGMLGVMIVPMPSWLLDFLLSFNLAFAVLFLVSAIFLHEPQRFTSLPTVLLLSTVFRLALNVSTTRSVLAGAEIPTVVIAFGDFVVGGNMVVGAVVFFIITVIQFLVIAKGAERVAEVAARFTLDAMPGKQMAIDADLRAGAISLADARVLRRDLQIESKLFGSLDGAMKFVKGDAIAGILITSVNIVAGVFIGCVQQQLSFEEALRKFGIFTIGDGLVSQMPALIVAAAAGIAITKVADQEQPLLGRAIVAQLAGDARVLFTAGFVLLFLGLTPGIPGIPFLISSFVLTLTALNLKVEKKQEVKKINSHVSNAIVLGFSPLALSDLYHQGYLMDLLHDLRQQHYEKWGVIVPEFEFNLKAEFTDKKVSIEFLDVLISTIEQNLETELIAKLSQILLRLNPNFINDKHTRILLELNQHAVEETANAIIPEQLSITSLTRVLRTLLQEEVSIRQFALILQEVAEFFSEGLFTKANGLNSMQIEGLLVTAVRKALASQICSQVSENPIIIYKVSKALDQKLSRYAISTEVLSADFVAQILEQLELISRNEKQRVIFVCSKFSRAILANIIKQDSRKDLVFSSEELLCEFSVKGELSLENEIYPLKKAA